LNESGLVSRLCDEIGHQISARLRCCGSYMA